MLRLAREVVDAAATYLEIAWWGLVSPRLSERVPLTVVQGVVRSKCGILLAVRTDLRGWELPGGTVESGEQTEETLRREILEETGLEIEIVAHVGDYVRSGFRPHTARVYRCDVGGGVLRTSSETRRLRWFDPEALPDTLFPWYRQPIEDALAEYPEVVERTERQGLASIVSAIRIDLRMRRSKDRAC